MVAGNGELAHYRAMVTEQKRQALRLRMMELEIRDADLTEKFIRGTGSGGQKINKTSSCVYLKHEPSGIEVKCQRERSREINRFLARRELCDLYEHKVLGRPLLRRLTKEDKIRKRKQRKARRQRAEDRDSNA